MKIEPANEKDLFKWKTRQGYKYFECYKGYECDIEGIIKFRKDLIQWANEAMTKSIKYLEYDDNSSAVLWNYLRFETNSLKKYDIILKKPKEYYYINNEKKMRPDAEYKKELENYEKNIICGIEFEYFEKTPNGGLITIDKDIIDKLIECFGYDFSSWYPHLLGSTDYDLKLPIRKGKLSKINDFKKQLKYGIYDCKITCFDKNFQKIFMFSKNNTYSHYSVNFCLKYKKRFNINIEILNLDKETNCYIYDEKDVIKSSEIFGTWFNNLFAIKQEFPKNKLIKHLLSSVWGLLSQYNRKVISSYQEYHDLDTSHMESNKNTEYKTLKTHEYFDEETYDMKMRFEVVNVSHPYKYNMRLKPFLTSYSRKMFAEFVINNCDLNDIIRVHTDSVVLRKEYDFTGLKSYPVPENKTSGHLIWSNVNTNNMTKQISCECGGSFNLAKIKQHENSVEHLEYLLQNF
jgi:hypothetical protein